MCPTLLEVKPSIWKALEMFELFCEGLTKVAHYNPKKIKNKKRTLNLRCIHIGMHPQLINMNCR
jgi:hypothetical protein